MGNLIFKAIALSSLLLILYFVVRVFYSVWWKPRSLEKHLKQQGMKGTSYKLLFGDMKDYARLMMETWSKPIPLSHRIVQRVYPFYYQMVQKYGKFCVTWTGAKPRIIVNDPELMRLILTDKNGDFEKLHSAL